MSHPIRPLFVALFLLMTIAHAVLTQAAESRPVRIADVSVRFHDLDLRKHTDAQSCSIVSGAPPSPPAEATRRFITATS